MKSKVKKRTGLSGTDKEDKDWPTGIWLLDVVALMGTVTAGAAFGMLLGKKLVGPSFIVAMYAIKKRNVYLMTASIGALVTARWEPKEAENFREGARDIKDVLINAFKGTPESSTNGFDVGKDNPS